MRIFYDYKIHTLKKKKNDVQIVISLNDECNN